MNIWKTYMNCGINDEMNEMILAVWKAKHFKATTRFEPMTSAIQVRCSSTYEAPNVLRLHSSVGRATHRYRGGHGFKSRCSLENFQAKSMQLVKLLSHCADHFIHFIISSFLRFWLQLRLCRFWIPTLNRMSEPGSGMEVRWIAGGGVGRYIDVFAFFFPLNI